MLPENCLQILNPHVFNFQKTHVLFIWLHSWRREDSESVLRFCLGLKLAEIQPKTSKPYNSAQFDATWKRLADSESSRLQLSKNIYFVYRLKSWRREDFESVPRICLGLKVAELHRFFSKNFEFRDFRIRYFHIHATLSSRPSPTRLNQFFLFPVLRETSWWPEMEWGHSKRSESTISGTWDVCKSGKVWE